MRASITKHSSSGNFIIELHPEDEDEAKQISEMAGKLGDVHNISFNGYEYMKKAVKFTIWEKAYRSD